MSASIDTPHTRLYLTGIPTDQNNFQNLSEYFEQFGKISEIKISYHGDAGAAMVSFASHTEANVAMNSQQPVLGNQGIKMRWCNRQPKQTSASQSTSSSSSPPSSSSSLPTSPTQQGTSKITFQCEKCTKILATKQTLENHKRLLHGEFQCPVCSIMFESGKEFRQHYNSVHSDSKDFLRRSVDSKGFVRNADMNFNFEHLTETYRQENYSLKKELKKNLKKHKKSKLKMDKEFQEKVLKLLEEKNERHAELETMRQKNNELMQKLDEEQKTTQAKVATYTTMKENYDRLQQENMQLTQKLMNEQMKVEMLRNTISVMYKPR